MKCNICENVCSIQAGHSGKCGLYINKGESITERFPNQYLIISPITIETMPMLHFQPRGKFLQITTVGCNLDCPGCISTVIVKEMDPALINLLVREPHEIVQEALRNDCLGICFLMNDPLASWPSFVKVAKEASEKGLFVGCSSNSYFTESSLEQILPYLNFINVGVKGFSDQIYQECGARSAQAVWRNIEQLYRSGVHVEISCVYRQNEEAGVLDLARQIADLSVDIPLHIMRFIPMENADPLQEPSIREAEALCRGLRECLNYVYLFNSPGSNYLNTNCPTCGEWVYKRDFYGPMGARLKDSRVDTSRDLCFCTQCGGKIAFNSSKTADKKECFREADFQGGYPFTRALEILESIVIAMGIYEKSKVVRVWNAYINQQQLDKLHHELQNPQAFIGIVRQISEVVGEPQKACELAEYLESNLSIIKAGQALIARKPRVYYAMGYPLFAIKGGRMENQLVEAAGGISVNKEVEIMGRPGMNISVDQLNALNPEIIFISAFISASVEDFYAECLRIGLDVEAVRNYRIYLHPAPGWDFGSPRWILGLINIANILHPSTYKIDLLAEADAFYRRFYKMPFIAEDINRSFSKPSCQWDWTGENQLLDRFQI